MQLSIWRQVVGDPPQGESIDPRVDRSDREPGPPVTGSRENPQEHADRAQTTADSAQSAADDAQSAADAKQTASNANQSASRSDQLASDTSQTAADDAQTAPEQVADANFLAGFIALRLLHAPAAALT